MRQIRNDWIGGLIVEKIRSL